MFGAGIWKLSHARAVHPRKLLERSPSEVNQIHFSTWLTYLYTRIPVSTPFLFRCLYVLARLRRYVYIGCCKCYLPKLSSVKRTPKCKNLITYTYLVRHKGRKPQALAIPLGTVQLSSHPLGINPRPLKQRLLSGTPGNSYFGSYGVRHRSFHDCESNHVEPSPGRVRRSAYYNSTGTI